MISCYGQVYNLIGKHFVLKIAESDYYGVGKHYF